MDRTLLTLIQGNLKTTGLFKSCSAEDKEWHVKGKDKTYLSERL